MIKTEIITALQKSFINFTHHCQIIDETTFFAKPTDKWSIAENVKHLIISTNLSALAFRLPKFLVRWVGGKPNRPSKSYDELVTKYKLKLAQGGRASSTFVPKPFPPSINKEKLLLQWKKVTEKFISALQRNRTESDLDNYLVKHPLLGRITLRELGYFTIYHTQHHQNNITAILATQ
jgi:hypothetical protein